MNKIKIPLKFYLQRYFCVLSVFVYRLQESARKREHFLVNAELSGKLDHSLDLHRVDGLEQGTRNSLCRKVSGGVLDYLVDLVVAEHFAHAVLNRELVRVAPAVRCNEPVAHE